MSGHVKTGVLVILTVAVIFAATVWVFGWPTDLKWAMVYLGSAMVGAVAFWGGWAQIREMLQQRIKSEVVKPSSKPAVPEKPKGPPFQARRDIPTFVGRADELARLTEVLCQGDAVSIHGVHGLFGLAGLGKTALAIHAAHRLRESFPDGVIWVDLPTAQPADVLADWARLYGGDVSRIENIEARADAVRGILRDKRILAVLDDARSNESLPPLLRALSDRAVIVTSRITNLPSLVHATLVNLDRLHLDEAWELFNRIVTDGRLEGDRKTVQDIGELLGYLPLALDIAARKMRQHRGWTTEDLLVRLRNAKSRLGELEWAGDYGVRTSFELSYEDLALEEQHFFASLGAFGGEDFDVAAAAAVAQVGAREASRALEVLFNLSLAEDGRRTGRYRLHLLLRDYAREKLDGEEAYERMAQHYLAVSKEAWKKLTKREEIETGLAVLDEELGNIRAGQAWAAGKVTEATWELTRDYIRVVTRYFSLRSHYDEWVAWGEAGLEACERLGDERGMGTILGGLGSVYARKGEWDRAIEFHEKSLEISERLEDTHGIAKTYGSLGSIYARKGEWDRAIEFYQRNLEMSERLENARGMALAYGGLGSVYARKGEWDRAIELHGKSLEIKERLEDTHGIAVAYGSLGSIYARKGEWDRAIEFYRRNLEISERLGNAKGMASAYGGLGSVYARKGRWDKAIELYQKDLEISERLGDAQGIASAYGGLGSVYAREGGWDKAIELYQKDLEISERLGYAQGMASACAGLGSVYKRKREWGKAISLYEKSLEISKRIGNDYGMAQTLGNLSFLYEAQGDCARALEYAAKALQIFHHLGAWETARMEELVRRLREKL